MLDYVVLYHSETGNTKKIATEIFSALPGMSKDLISITEVDNIPQASTYFVGFCVHCNTCSLEIGDFLGDLSGKRVALFGTCGLAPSQDAYKKIENNVSIWIEDDNEYLGAFLCQGKMSLDMRRKCEQKLGSKLLDELHAKKILQNFDEAMIHPTDEDLKNARDFAIAHI
ncbi:flavodoxin family protein [Lachnospiraceae bacterium OttesenSCG-928-E19]|nr:flavodoxin family protein [Lachnospiraceae bacterium OttesenSCG-928-E19]